MGGLSPAPRSISIRKKDTHYGGTTPKLGSRVIKPFTSEVIAALKRTAKSGQESAEGLVGINPTFLAEDIPTIVKRDKTFVFFGKEEVVANAALIFRPLVEVGVAVKTGVIRKRIELRYLILDGQTGKFVELGDTPTMYEGLQRLIGLDSQQIEVLQTTRPDRDMSILEIANKLSVSKEMLRKPIRLLEEKRLIRSFQLGKSRVFRRIFVFPYFQWHESEQPLEPVPVHDTKGKVEEYKLDEEKVREVIKGLIPYSDIQSFKRFVFPLYRVELIMRRKKRVVWLDGRTGKEIHP